MPTSELPLAFQLVVGGFAFVTVCWVAAFWWAARRDH